MKQTSLILHSEIIRTQSSHADFVQLVRELDHYLAIVDGDEHDFYHQYNQIENLDHVVLLSLDGKTVSCGAFKKLGDDTVEMKRMWTRPDHRGKGCASTVLGELEQWASEEGYSNSMLETGRRMQDAVKLYLQNGYAETENYGQYIGVENSICFKKSLVKK